MARTVHVALCVRGALLNWKARDFRSLVDRETGRPLTAREGKAALLDLLAEGVEMLPIGTPCEGFDPKTGCPGHEIPDPDPSPDQGTETPR